MPLALVDIGLTCEKQATCFNPTYEICDRIESGGKRYVLTPRLPLRHSRVVGGDRHLGRKPCKIRKSLIQIAAAKESIHLNLDSIEAS